MCEHTHVCTRPLGAGPASGQCVSHGLAAGLGSGASGPRTLLGPRAGRDGGCLRPHQPHGPSPFPMPARHCPSPLSLGGAPGCDPTAPTHTCGLATRVLVAVRAGCWLQGDGAQRPGQPAMLPPLPEAGCRQLLLGYLCLCDGGPHRRLDARRPPITRSPTLGPGPRGRRDVRTRGWTDTQLAAGRGCRELAEAGAGGRRVARRVLEILASCFPNKGPSVPRERMRLFFREQRCFLLSSRHGHRERGP